MPTEALLRRGLVRISDRASADLAALITPSTDFVEVRTQLEIVLPDLVENYGNASGSWAADWYDETRIEHRASGSFRAAIPAIGETGTDALAGWAVSPMVEDAAAFDTVIVKAQGGLTRRVQNVGRQTIMTSAIQDPAARGWQRVGRTDACEFCRMLIGRGAVYTEATSDFDSHDHCHCSAVPAWSSN